ncbi:hypothetical protein D3C78_1321850 [compost metagenome]
MNVQLHGKVRRNHQPRLLGQCLDLEVRGYATDTGRVGHQVIGCAQFDELPVLGNAGEHFTGRDRRIELQRQRGMTFGVIAIERFLDPDQVERLKTAAHALRSGPVPLLVSIDHQWEAIAQVFADGADPMQIQCLVRLSDLELDTPNALFPREVGIGH